MSLEQNKAIARRWHEGWWGENSRGILDELLTPDSIIYGIGGSDEISQFVEDFKQQTSNQRMVIEELVAEGDKVVARWTLRFRHTGNLWGYLATGRQIEYTGITIQRIEHGRILEDRYETDFRGLEKQLRG